MRWSDRIRGIGALDLSNGRPFIAAGADASEPVLELVHIGGSAAETDVAIGPDRDESGAGCTGESMESDVGPEIMLLELVGVTVQQHVDAGPSQ